MSYRYRIYGLTVASDLALPGVCALLTTQDSPDLLFHLGTMPAWAEQALQLPITSTRTRPKFELPGDPIFSVSEVADGQVVLLSYGDGTRFLLDGSCTRLWGQTGAGLSYEDLCVYLLGPVMGFVLRRTGFSPLHASAISIQENAIALVGEAGAGKSTTAAALALRGWPVLCEDICAFDEIDEKFCVRPAYPRISLWPDSVGFLFSSSDALPLIVNGWEKRFLQLDGSSAHFAESSAPLSAIFFLAPRSDNADAPFLETVSSQEAVLHLVQDTYMNWLLDGNQRAAEFDVLTRLVQSVACFRVTPSANSARLPRLADLIEEQSLRLVSPASNPAARAAHCDV